MASTVAKMTRSELKEIIESTVEKKLLQLLGDPDQGLALRKAVKDRLLRQQKAVAEGERGELLSAVASRKAFSVKTFLLATLSTCDFSTL